MAPETHTDTRFPLPADKFAGLGRYGPPVAIPAARERAPEAPPLVGAKFERYEEITAAAGTGGAFTEIGTFSGRPDAIDLVATGGDALVRLTDELGREESSLRLIANVPRETWLSKRRVSASNVSDAAQATVRATGKWAVRGE